MKKIFALIIILLSSVCYSQKQYDFDYILQYDTFFKDSVKIKKSNYEEFEGRITRYFLINSKQNEYFAIISEEDSLNYRLNFNDHERKLHSKGVFLKSGLNDAELINVNCENIYSSMNLIKNEDYDFIKLKDTLINNESLLVYKSSVRSSKKRERKQNGTYFFIIEKSSNLKLPVFTDLKIFEKWILNNKLPKGFIRERYYIDYSGKLIFNEKFIELRKTEKRIYVPKRCN